MELTEEKLAALKRYMRAEELDEDAAITALYAAAVRYLENAGIPEPAEEDPSAALYTLAVHSLTLHWFENRGDVITGTIMGEIPLGLRPIINQLKFTGFA